MYSVAIVEDDAADRECLVRYLDRLAPSVAEGVHVRAFSSGLDLLDAYPDDLDVLLLDIEMPDLNGIEVARRVRDFDQRVSIVFVTNLYQFALEGYRVRAMDFLVKPLRYTSFRATMEKAFELTEKRRPRYVRLEFDKASRLVDITTITYVETQRKRLLIHTKGGDEYCSGPLRLLEEKLAPYGFASIHQSYLVNMKYVEHVGQTTVVVAGDELPLSRHKRQQFITELTDYVGKVL